LTTVTQRSFSSGEISPSLYARTDIVKHATGLRTVRNNIILRYGGSSNRPGTQFIAEVSDPTKGIRLVPFVFSDTQTYILEFGEGYMRVHKNGVQQTLSGQAITGITQANPAVFTVTAHGYSNGDEVFVSGVSGMTQVNNRNFKVANVTANTFEITDLFGNNIDSTGYDAYTSGGLSYKVYEITTPYLESELSELQYVQSADVVTLVHPNHAPAELSRTGDTSWSLADVSFAPSIDFPTSVSVSAGGAGSENYRYKVTAIDAETGEESLAGTITAAVLPTGATQANPVVITAAGHGYAQDDEIYIENIQGMTELNGRNFFVDNPTANTFELFDTDGTNYSAYTSNGTIRKTFTELVSASVPSTSAPHTISWSRVSSAIEYNIYKESNGVYGQIGVATGTSFEDINITPNTSLIPPISRNPFVGTGNYPSAVSYIQQRLTFANTDNDPEKIFMSRTANFKNFTTSTPTQSDDAVTFNMAGRQINEVKSLVDLGRLVVMTTGGEWSLSGGTDGVITPTTVNPKQYSYNGSGNLQPIIIDGSAIYQQARGSIIRDLAYNFEVDGYNGSDLTLFSAHLFDKFTLSDWAFQQIPHSILWVVRSDGELLGMTYVKNQQVIAWHHHDTEGGTFENVAVVPEGNEDALYVTVKRTVNGQERRYIERLASRKITDIVDNIFMDSSLSYDGRNTGSTTMTLSGGTTWESTETLTLTASVATFVSTDPGNIIQLKILDSAGEVTDIVRFTINAYTSSTVVTGKPHKTVPAALRSTATTAWAKAVDELAGLWHLEGKDVSVFGDGFVVASPNNDSYDTVTVSSGKITLDKPYAVIHVGLPYLCDLETLDIDTNNGETLQDKNKIVDLVNMFVEETRGVFVGPKPPSNDTTDPLEDLIEFKIRNSEDYDSPVSLTTDNIDVNIKGEWNSNGRVFIRQVDPIPMTILSISPAGRFPFR
jgi:hypothetical protein